MSFCIPYSDYLANAGLYDLLSVPADSCAGCGTQFNTPVGLNVRLNPIPLSSGAILTVIFHEVTVEGNTTIAELIDNSTLPIEDGTLDLLQSWQIVTDAVYSGEMRLELVAPQDTSESDFKRMLLLDATDGGPSDITLMYEDGVSPDYASRTIYAKIADNAPNLGMVRATAQSSKVEKTIGWWLWSCYWFGLGRGKPCFGPKEATFRTRCVTCEWADGGPDDDAWKLSYSDGKCKCIRLGACCPGGSTDATQILTEEDCHKFKPSPPKKPTWYGGYGLLLPGGRGIACCSLDCESRRGQKNAKNCDECECENQDWEICGSEMNCFKKCDPTKNLMRKIEGAICSCVCNPTGCPAGKKLKGGENPNCECECDPTACPAGKKLKDGENPNCECACETEGTKPCTKGNGTEVCAKECKTQDGGGVQPSWNEQCECECADQQETYCDSVDAMKPTCVNCSGTNRSMNPDNCECRCDLPCSIAGQKLALPPADCTCVCDETRNDTYNDCRCRVANPQKDLCPAGMTYGQYPNCDCFCTDTSKIKCGDECKDRCESSEQNWNSDCTQCVCDNNTSKNITCGGDCYYPCGWPGEDGLEGQTRNPNGCQCECPNLTFAGAAYQGAEDGPYCAYSVKCWYCENGAVTSRNTSLRSVDITGPMNYWTTCPAIGGGGFDTKQAALNACPCEQLTFANSPATGTRGTDGICRYKVSCYECDGNGGCAKKVASLTSSQIASRPNCSNWPNTATGAPRFNTCDGAKAACISSSSSSACPPGYRKVSRPGFLRSLADECVPDCKSELFECLPGFCCTENPFTGGNDCLLCSSSSSSNSSSSSSPPRWSCNGSNSCVEDPSGSYDSEAGCLDGAYFDCGCETGFTYNQGRGECVTDLFYCA